MHGTPVEVRKNVKSTTWYNAVLLDVNGDDVRVGFEDDIWPSRDVPASSVRRCPEDSGEDDFSPQIDEVVEVLVSASESNPSGWAHGRVKTIKNSFYFITFTSTSSTQKAKQDLIVERNALRRANGEKPLDVSKIFRKLIPVDPELHQWIRSQDSLGCLSHVQSKGQLLVATCSNTEATTEKDPEVLLLGGEREVQLGEKLLTTIHFKYQIEMQRFHEERDRLMERLAQQRQWYSAQHQEVFSVDQSLVGKIIGKKGENINDIRERHGVEVYIEDTTSSSSRGARPMSTITVTGETAESVKAARDELEFITVKIPVEADQVGWILGKGYQTITDIAKKTELHHARYDGSSNSLELCGLRHQVEDAKLLISVHREYLPVYQDMDEEQHLIQQSFDQLDERSGYSKGKGKKGSKGEEDSYPSKGKDGKDGKDGKGKTDDGWYGKDGKGKDWKGGDGKGEGKDGRGKGKDKGMEEYGKNGKGKDGKDGKGKDGKGTEGKEWRGKDGKDDGRKGKDGKGWGKDEGYGDDGKGKRKGKGGKDY
mmetsp:Transcript_20134/g.35736  ORF Transcript_20134/g.35736 Transcript_20134/m.35736 type:complete len:538 (-) Transcript_20134:78-1691(-)